MNYDVHWPDDVLQYLVSFYETTVQGDGRETAALNAALSEIDDLLRRRPTQAGESRAGRRRMVSVAPLTVYFQADPQTHRVEVLNVHYYRRRR